MEGQSVYKIFVHNHRNSRMVRVVHEIDGEAISITEGTFSTTEKGHKAMLAYIVKELTMLP